MQHFKDVKLKIISNKKVYLSYQVEDLHMLAILNMVDSTYILQRN